MANLEELLSKEEVLQAFFTHWKPEFIQEDISISNANGRVLASDYSSLNTLPVVRCSGMDGIGVCFDDFAQGIPDVTNWKLEENYCMADTGDDFSEKFDTVIAVEKTKFMDGKLAEILYSPKEKGECVRPAGNRILPQEIVGEKGEVLTPLRIANLATGGVTNVKVYKRPRVIYIPTGSELVEMGRTPARGENIETNGLMVANLLEQWGFACEVYPICRDIKSDLEKQLLDATEKADIVLVNGGSSKGSEDFNTGIIEKNSSYSNHGVRAVPGRPMSIGLVQNCPVVNLPGPPLATFAVLQWCVKELLYHAMNASAPRLYTTAKLTQEASAPDILDLCQLVHLAVKNGELQAELLSMRAREADIMRRTNAFMVLQAGKSYAIGETVLVERLYE